MFKFLKEKIANWAKGISKDKRKKEEESLKKPTIIKKEKKEKQVKADKKAKKEVLEELQEKGVVDEEVIEQEEEKPGFFSRIKSKISKVTVSEEEFDRYSDDLMNLLLENNVAYEIAERTIKVLKARIVGKEMMKKEIEMEIKDVLRTIISEVLIEPFNLEERIAEKQIKSKNEPFVILFAGINGTGKTTTIAKISHYLKKYGISTVIAAGDTFRAASIEQLKKHGEKLGVKIIHQEYGADPAAIGFDAISYAKKNHIGCVLIDTAGRMHTAKNLMKEIEKIAKVCKPDLKIFIGESITGNDAIEQVKAFDSAIGVDALILSKADIDEKGGTALSLGFITKKPILFLGTGQNYEDIEAFSKKKFIEKLGL